mmetsp:Transcript_8326/g.17906  ORF Transcript_8326/g.17906 Transcript_8326/m.17906 type:complete len:466 (-) Transcript_8326:310-1707(-)
MSIESTVLTIISPLREAILSFARSNLLRASNSLSLSSSQSSSSTARAFDSRSIWRFASLTWISRTLFSSSRSRRAPISASSLDLTSSSSRLCRFRILSNSSFSFRSRSDCFADGSRKLSGTEPSPPPLPRRPLLVKAFALFARETSAARNAATSATEQFDGNSLARIRLLSCDMKIPTQLEPRRAIILLSFSNLAWLRRLTPIVWSSRIARSISSISSSRQPSSSELSPSGIESFSLSTGPASPRPSSPSPSVPDSSPFSLVPLPRVARSFSPSSSPSASPLTAFSFSISFRYWAASQLSGSSIFSSSSSPPALSSLFSPAAAPPAPSSSAALVVLPRFREGDLGPLDFEFPKLFPRSDRSRFKLSSESSKLPSSSVSTRSCSSSSSISSRSATSPASCGDSASASPSGLASAAAARRVLRALRLSARPPDEETACCPAFFSAPPSLPFFDDAPPETPGAEPPFR